MEKLNFKGWLEAGQPFVVDYDVDHLIDSILDDFPVPRQHLSQMVHELVAKNSHLTKAGIIKLIRAKIRNWLPDWGTGQAGRPPWISAKMAQIGTETED